MTDRSCCEEYFEDTEEIDDTDDTESYDDERYFPYKRPVMSDSEFVPTAGFRHKTLVQPAHALHYKKPITAAGAGRSVSRRRVLLRWHLGQVGKGVGWDGKF